MQWHGLMAKTEAGLTAKAEAVEQVDDDPIAFPSQNTQPREHSMKKRRRGSQREANADITGLGSSQTSAGNSGSKRVTRSSARLSAN